MNVEGISRDSFSVCQREKNLPKIYQTYLNNCGYINNQLSMDDFLQMYGLKYMPRTRTWRWIKCVALKYCERQKNIFVTGKKMICQIKSIK